VGKQLLDGSEWLMPTIYHFTFRKVNAFYLEIVQQMILEKFKMNDVEIDIVLETKFLHVKNKMPKYIALLYKAKYYVRNHCEYYIIHY